MIAANILERSNYYAAKTGLPLGMHGDMFR